MTRNESMNTAPLMTVALTALAAVATTVGFAAPARAYPEGSFQSPSGNIVCILAGDGQYGVACQIHQHTYAAPPAGSCDLGGWGSQIDLDPGQPPHFECVGGELAVQPMPTLDYGQKRSAGPFTCDSEPAGMSCTDSSTGHFFRLSHDSYQVG